MCRALAHQPGSYGKWAGRSVRGLPILWESPSAEDLRGQLWRLSSRAVRAGGAPGKRKGASWRTEGLAKSTPRGGTKALSSGGAAPFLRTRPHGSVGRPKAACIFECLVQANSAGAPTRVTCDVWCSGVREGLNSRSRSRPVAPHVALAAPGSGDRLHGGIQIN